MLTNHAATLLISRITDLWTWPDVMLLQVAMSTGRKRNCSFSASSLPTTALSPPLYRSIPISSRSHQHRARWIGAAGFHQKLSLAPAGPVEATLKTGRSASETNSVSIGFSLAQSGGDRRIDNFCPSVPLPLGESSGP